MNLIILLVFGGAFSVVAVLMIKDGTGASQQTKKVLATLDSALATSWTNTSDQIVDLRKQELLSAIPWINRWLLKIELAPRLRLMLYQSSLKWTAGGLILMCGAAALIPAYLAYLRVDVVSFALLIGVIVGFAPLAFVFHRRARRFGQI